MARAGLDAHVAEEGRAPQYLQAWLAKPSQGLPFDVLRRGQTKPASIHLCGESPAVAVLEVFVVLEGDDSIGLPWITLW